jgi:hypothetical protein
MFFGIEGFRQKGADGVRRTHLLSGRKDDPRNFGAALTFFGGAEAGTPEAEAAAIRDVLAPGWEALFKAHPAPLLDITSGSVHVGGTIERAGHTLELLHALPLGEAVPEVTTTEIARRAADRLLEVLDAHEPGAAGHR